MADLDDFRTEIRAKHSRAEEALIRGDVAPRIETWSRKDPVTLFSAGGEHISGWAEVSEFFRSLARRFSNGSGFTFELVAAEVSGDLAYTVGFERFNVSISGGPVQPRTIRVTHVYRRENSEWKIVHRHGDSPRSDASAP